MSAARAAGNLLAAFEPLYREVEAIDPKHPPSRAHLLKLHAAISIAVGGVSTGMALAHAADPVGQKASPKQVKVVFDAMTKARKTVERLLS